ncbi:hypothetical protein BGM19_26675 [Streptomyces agglomeratus]|nr:hypothetical protein BGM19_26675 [Streptomyces agglomeratus]
MATGSDTTFTLNGDAAVVAGHIEHVILETRKRDTLEGEKLERRVILDAPFVREGHWTDAWARAINPTTARPSARILIVVAPRSIGSTTFALQLLARHTDSTAAVVKLEGDWRTPSVGRLPLEKLHAYQLDLKDAATDRPSADFVHGLANHAKNLDGCNSYLVLTVAKELWDNHYVATPDGIAVVHLTDPPSAQSVVEAHLRHRGYPGLVPYVQSDDAKDSIRGLDAVDAARATTTVVMQWEEHDRRNRLTYTVRDPLANSLDIDDALRARVTAALSDWKDKLDVLFGEVVSTHGRNASLTLEDRCLLLSLALHQSAPVPTVAATARSLQDTMAKNTQKEFASVSNVSAVFAGRGLRRRISDVEARVDSHDCVLFDQPAYGRAIMAYVWDNYEVMRPLLLDWLVQASGSSDATDPAVRTLIDLTLRHETSAHFEALSAAALATNPDVLSAVMTGAVQDEHVGRLAWGTLYQWAGRQERGLVVISTCRRVLESADTSPSAAKMAMVRLRRVAQKTDGGDTRKLLLATFQDLASHPAGATRLVAEVQEWQQSKRSSTAGSLAFLALMSVDHDDMPWLMSDAAPDIDVEAVLRDLLGDITKTPEVIPALTVWVRKCAADPDSYKRIRDGLLAPLRGQKMFKAGMELMRALNDVETGHGVNVAEDFYNNLVDARLQKVFPLDGGNE